MALPPTTATAAMPTATAATAPREIAPFLKSLRAMLDDESDAVLRWTPDGRAFEIRDVQALTKAVLPKYFKHAKYASFQRQLNYFHFRKWTKSRTEVCTFANPHFQRDEPHLSWRILRKRSLSDVAPATTATTAPATTATANQHNVGDSSSSPSPSPSPSPPMVTSMSGSEDSASLVCESPRSELDVALDWIDAVFPSLEMLYALGEHDNDRLTAVKKAKTAMRPSQHATKSKPMNNASARRRHRRDAPMPPQSYEYVSW